MEETVSSEYKYKGRLLKLRVDRVRLPGGRQGTREIVEHPGAVAVVPLDRQGNVYLVRQYRKPVEEYLLEIPAGTLEPGEGPLDCARRELAEETGLEAEKIELILHFYTSPGICTENMYVYLATGLSPAENGLERDEDEHIQLEKYKVAELGGMIKGGKIKDGKTLVGLGVALSIYKPSPA